MGKALGHGYCVASVDTPEYQVWGAIVQRCTNPKNRNYHRYGGRGVGICDEWRDFARFIADMGPRPTPWHTIDRIDNDRGYEPGNCRWTTPIVQNQNRRSTKLEHHEPAQIRWLAALYSRSEVASAFDVSYQTVTKVVNGERWPENGIAPSRTPRGERFAQNAHLLAKKGER